MGKDRQFGLLSALCLVSTGCFSYPPYGYPTTYAPPHTAMAPQPYRSVQVPPGTVWVPASPSGTNSVMAPDPMRQPAPTTFSDDHEPSSSKSVPEPTEPGKSPPQETTEPFGLNDDAAFEKVGVRTSRQSRPRPPGDQEIAGTSTTIEPELADSGESLVTSDEFRLPRSGARSADFQTQVRSNTVTPIRATKPRFGYDADSYSWLRGIIEFEPKHRIWHLTYSQFPDDDDQFGGEVTLKNPQDFKYLRSGQAIEVVGEFDPIERDRLGKPVYEVSEIVPAKSR